MAKTAKRQLGGRLLLFGECLRRWTNLNVQYRKFSTSLLAQYFTLTRILKSIQGRAGGWRGGGGTQQMFIRGGSAPQSNPLPFYIPFFTKKVAWENRRHFATPPTVFPRNDVWETSAEIPYWWRVTTQIWVVLLIVKSLPFRTPEAWKRYPVRAEPPGIGHHRVE